MGKIFENKMVARALFSLGLLLSFILRLRFPHLYHHFDVHTFKEWIPFVSDLKTVYTTSCYCNYPVVGLLLSSGIMEALGSSVQAFLYFVASFDLLNAVLIYMTLLRMKVNQALGWAAIISLIPSTWVGGALWGQIDTIGQSELLLFLLLFIRWNYREQLALKLGISFLMGIILAVSLLTKQLLLFPVLFFGFLTILVWISQEKQRLLYILLAIIGFTLPIIIIDSWLTLPDGSSISHFQKIFIEGSEHVNFISGNGFNLWMLFVDEMYTPSTDSWILGLSPKLMGIFIVGAIGAITFYTFFIKYASKEFRELFAYFLLAYSILFLSVNLFFTGTHERYLYHFYPFLITALLLLKANRILLVITLIGSITYGLFVFGILKQYHHSQWFFSSYTAHRIIFVIHFVILVYLMTFYLRSLKYGSKKGN